MVSFISTLSLFLLVLASGYYTAPVTHETTSLSNEHDPEATGIPEHAPRFSSDSAEHEATSVDPSQENTVQGLRLVLNDEKDELSTPETTSKDNPSGSHGNGDGSESNEETGNEKSNSGKTYQRRGMLDESTTTTTKPTMPSHSTSSTSTIKYTGLLKDEESQPTGVGHSEKPNKPKPKPKPEEPTATLGATLVDLGTVPEIGKHSDGVMQYDVNTIPSITDPSTTTMEGKTKPPKKPLNEGEKPSQSEEEKSD